MKNIFVAVIVSLALLLMPVAFVQAQTEAPDLGSVMQTQDPIKMLEGIITLVVERAPQLISQLFSLIISVVMAFVGFLQLAIQLCLTPEGFPLLVSLFMAGVMGAFNWGITGGIYGFMIGLPLLFVPVICTTPIGAILGAILGFIYEALAGGRAEYPAPVENPYLESWKELIP